MKRKTKIVCTIGPASESYQMLEKLARAGMDVARLNFSHGTYEEHAQRIAHVRRVSAALGRPLGILQDLPGPKIRTGKLKADKVWLQEGEEIILTTETILGDEHRVSVTLDSLARDVRPGDTIFVNDGIIRLEVRDTTATEIRCLIAAGGVLTQMKGINVPGVKLSLEAVTDDDLRHLSFGLEHGIDFVALSFICNAHDVNRARAFIRERGADVPIVAKIERSEALKNIDEIIDAADIVMVARGDLGVEVPLRRVPIEQKRIVAKCNAIGKPVIVATQMLESMVFSPRPTRAEASDVANAIFDGADAVMLSEETATGGYPVQAAGTMAAIAVEAAGALPYHTFLSEKEGDAVPQPDDAISFAAVHIAEQIGANAILAFTTSGSTAMRVAKYRPKCPVLAITTSERVLRRLALVWGLTPVLTEEYQSMEELYAKGSDLARMSGVAQPGDIVVMTAGIPFAVAGNTNILKIHQIQ
ncbi:MAG: pyruvate kinase [Dehalococcoidia bacterium]|nr:pyruvate kinase [Dehalococcoidia bacterium]